jgi:hypothetical protein
MQELFLGHAPRVWTDSVANACMDQPRGHSVCGNVLKTTRSFLNQTAQVKGTGTGICVREQAIAASDAGAMSGPGPKSL